MTDPVDIDLRRHLAQQEADECLSEAVDERVDEWMKDKAKVEKYLEPLFEFVTESDEVFNIIVAAVLGGKSERLLGWFEDGLRQGMREDAEAAVRKEIDQSWNDKAESEIDHDR